VLRSPSVESAFSRRLDGYVAVRRHPVGPL